MKLNFTLWFEAITLGTEEVDERQIDSAYKNAKYAVKLVQMYDKSLPLNDKLLLNVSTIATLNQGVYGLYNSKEAKEVITNQIPPQILNKIKMIFGNDIIGKESIDNLSRDTIKGIPLAVIKQKIPEINVSMLKSSDVIHVNVQKHVSEHGDTAEGIFELASTIVHESQHALDMSKNNKTDEGSAKGAEKRFSDWFKRNINQIKSQIPLFASINIS